MLTFSKSTAATLGALTMSLGLSTGVAAFDMEKAHATAIKNCVNWNGLSEKYCTCVQDRVRAGLPNDSYLAVMQFAQAYEENRRADMAAMQVDVKVSKALEPVDAVVNEAKQACKG